MIPNRQAGMTLVELMVSIAAGVVVMFAVTNLLIGTLSGNTTNMRYTRMNQDLRSVVEAISKDLTRAGEWALADDIVHASTNTDLLLSSTSGSATATGYKPGSVTTNNAFLFQNNISASAALTNRTLVVLTKNAAGANTRYNLTVTGVPNQNEITLTIPSGVTLPTNKLLAGSWTILNPFTGIVVNGAEDCVLSSYDLDGDGVQDADERFGFRLKSATVQATTTSTDCDAMSGWEGFTDPAFLTITAFKIDQLRTTLPASNQINVALDQYLIGVKGELVKESSAKREVSQAVKVRNNAYN